MAVRAYALRVSVFYPMEVRMNTKNILTLVGAVMLLQGIGFIAMAAEITAEAFAAMEPDATALGVGMIMHEVLGVMCLVIALILLFSRNLEPAAGAKVLMGAGLGIGLVLIHAVYNMLETKADPPVPVLVVMAILMVLSLMTAKKASGSAG